MKSIIVAILMALVLSFAPTNAGGSDRPRFDSSIGQTEEQIAAKEGRPEYSKFLRSRDLVGELRFPLMKMLDARKANGPIKELYYHKSSRIHIYWLLEKDGTWTVVKDSSFSPDTRF